MADDDAAFFENLRKKGLGININQLVKEGEAERSVYDTKGVR
jgi:hypothetical protein